MSCTSQEGCNFIVITFLNGCRELKEGNEEGISQTAAEIKKGTTTET